MTGIVYDLVTGCDEDEAILTWAGDATVFTTGDEGRLSWRLSNRDGGTVEIPPKAGIDLLDASGSLADTLPVCLEPANTTDPLLWADVNFAAAGPCQARLTVQFADLSTLAALIEVAVRD